MVALQGLPQGPKVYGDVQIGETAFLNLIYRLLQGRGNGGQGRIISSTLTARILLIRATG